MRVRLTGIAKLPFVRPAAAALDFGATPLGRPTERSLPIGNGTPAPAAWRLARPSDETAAEASEAAVFTALPASGQLGGLAAAELRCAFTPVVPGLPSLARLLVTTPGGAPAQLVLRGSCVAPRAALTPHELGFGFHALGALVPPRQLRLSNASEGPLAYAVLLSAAPGEAWAVEPAAGTIPANGFVLLRASFKPAAAANHRRRLTVLVEHVGPLFCHLAGAGYTQKARPPALPDAPPSDDAARRLAPARFCAGDDADGLALDTPSLAFDGGAGERTVSAHNRTATPLRVFWHAAQSGAFVVTPVTAELPPRGRAAFKVSFRPTTGGAAAAALECHGHVASQAGWRLPADAGPLQQPWCAPLLCVGHGGGAQHGAPRIVLSAAVLPFAPGCAGGAPTLRTLGLTLSAAAGAPVAWALAEGPSGESPFQVRPACGLLRPGATTLLACAFVPPAAPSSDEYSFVLHFLANGAPATAECRLTARAYEPAVTFCHAPAGVSFRLPPAAVGGGASSRTLAVRNATPLPLRCAWIVPPELAGILAPSPAEFTLPGRDSAAVSVAFTPPAPSEFAAQLRLLLAHDDGTLAPDVTLQAGVTPGLATASLAVTASGVPCALSLHPCSSDQGWMAPGSSAELEATLRNGGDAAVAWAWGESEPKGALSFAGPASGVLPPRATLPLRLRLHCPAAGPLRARLPLHVGGGTAAQDALVYEACCRGDPPRLAFADAAAPTASPAAAWELLGVAALNAGLSDESPAAAARLHQLPLGVAAAGSSASLTHLWLVNAGRCAAAWRLVMSDDAPDGSAEASADADTADAADAAALALFAAEPRSGMLAPGATVCLALAYGHEAAGEHAMHAWLRVGGLGAAGLKGPSLRLRLSGRTLSSLATPALWGPGLVPPPPQPAELAAPPRLLLATLPAVAIGRAVPVHAAVPLRSACGRRCRYALDTAPLAALAAASFGFPVLTCEAPTGELPAGGVAQLLFAAWPISAEDYSADLALLLLPEEEYSDDEEGGVSHPAAETLTLRLTLPAYDPRAPPRRLVPPGRRAACPGEPSPPPRPGALAAVSPAALRLPTVLPHGVATGTLRLVPSDAAGPPLHFAWRCEPGGELSGGAHVAIAPAAGVLPAAGLDIRITCRAGTLGSVVASLRCDLSAAPLPPPLMALPPARLPAQPEGEEEETYAEHGMHLGAPPPPPRLRTSALRTPTLSSAAKYPAAMPPPPLRRPPPSAGLALAAGLGEGEAGLLLVDLSCLVSDGIDDLDDEPLPIVPDAPLPEDPGAKEAGFPSDDGALELVGSTPTLSDAGGSTYAAIDDALDAALPRSSQAYSEAPSGVTAAVDDALTEALEAAEMAQPDAAAEEAALAAGSAFLDAVEEALGALEEEETA